MGIEDNFVPEQDKAINPEIASLVEALFSADGTTQKTVLDARQVIVLARAQAFAELYKIPELTTLCDYLMQLKISEKGRGRKDLVQALQSRKPEVDENTVELQRQRRRILG